MTMMNAPTVVQDRGRGEGSPRAGSDARTREPRAARTRPLVRTELRADGVAILTIDDETTPHNTLTPELGAELPRALETLAADGRVKAVVVASGKPASFLVGANIDDLATVRFAEDAETEARAVAALLGRLASGRKPFVACVHGPALGGGFELALACAAIVATDHPRTSFGLPEAKLGLLPAGNGLLRVAERAGLRTALDLGLTARTLSAAGAHQLGLVDEVVAPAIALEAACRRALSLAEVPPKKRGAARGASPLSRRRLERLLLEQNPVARAILLRRVRAQAAARSSGHYPAVDRIIDVVERMGARGFRAAADLEARSFGELVVSETSHRLVELFFAHTATKKDRGLEADERAEAAPVASAAVVGAGLMGAGIAAVTVSGGVAVRLKDRDVVSLGRGARYVHDDLQTRARRGAMASRTQRDAFARLSTAVDYTGLAGADIVVEAVFEDLALKHEVLREVEKRVGTTCVIASNTASIPIARIAEAAIHPERVLGMHYFAPVTRVPLVEVVRAKGTSPRAVATAVALGRRQGKTVIVVRDGIGFYTTRTLAPYLHEAMHLLEEGVSVGLIDEALVDWGFSMGPLHLLDELGIDLAAHVAATVQTAFGERLRAPGTLAALRMDDRKGRKNGRGFYLYGRGRRAEKRVDDTVYDAMGVHPARFAADAHPKREEIQARCALAMINEALRCLDEGVLRSARDGDVGAVLGLGFPAFRGGPFRYVDVLGATEVLRRTRSLEQRYGERFTPAPLLVDAARRGKRFWST